MMEKLPHQPPKKTNMKKLQTLLPERPNKTKQNVLRERTK